MNPLESLIARASEVEEKIGYVFQDKSLLALAFVHRSFVNENRKTTQQHNERLEFLGDAVLGLLISAYLYRYLPETPEGELSSLRSQLVEAGSCMAFVHKLEIEPYLLLGKGEQRNGGRGRDSILADLFEAVMGAIYLDGGIDACQRFLFDNFTEDIDKIMRQPTHNWKAELQDYSQKHFQQPPQYQVIDESGPDHSKTFTVAVEVNGLQAGVGKGSSKKEAQQQAAMSALSGIEQEGEAV